MQSRMQSDRVNLDPVSIEAGLTTQTAHPWWIEGVKMFCGAIFFVLFTIMVFEIVNRYYDLVDIRWSEEVTRSLLIWFVFIGFGLASGLDQNIKADLTSSIQNGISRTALNILATGCTVLLLFGILVVGFQLTMIGLNTRMISLNVPTAIVTCAVPVGAALGILVLAGRFVRRFFGPLQQR